MRHAIILGAGGHCRTILSILNEVKVYQFFDIVELGFPSGETIMNVPTTANTSIFESIETKEKIDVFLAIGDNNIRKYWWDRLKELEFSMPNLISPRAIVDPFAKLDEANVVCARAFIGPECRIGCNNLINTGAILEHEVSVSNHCHVGPSSTIAGRSHLQDQCFIGVGATVINHISIASNTILGAGSVLIKSVENSNGTYVGVPAKRVLKSS